MLYIRVTQRDRKINITSRVLSGRVGRFFDMRRASVLPSRNRFTPRPCHSHITTASTVLRTLGKWERGRKITRSRTETVSRRVRNCPRMRREDHIYACTLGCVTRTFPETRACFVERENRIRFTIALRIALAHNIMRGGIVHGSANNFRGEFTDPNELFSEILIALR